MDLIAQEKANQWLQGQYDEETKAVISQLSVDNPKELEDSFYRNLEFGTGGLRGLMGVGTNRMNKYTVGRAFICYSRFRMSGRCGMHCFS